MFALIIVLAGLYGVLWLHQAGEKPPMSRREVIIAILSALLVAVIQFAVKIFTLSDEAEPRLAPPQIADRL
jgi:hypothetical protein